MKAACSDCAATRAGLRCVPALVRRASAPRRGAFRATVHNRNAPRTHEPARD
ncbi:hypothetical protein GLE_5420 [Lysobacter enzymogenes]|uniref:Uncharacterized protein n=1 Tax=Lysobacter enzymogenes TaxID=69 RepID=A0A0S2DQQ8_LYSEN|nr:hypothetical protein GLE_5420 [Lysobacter enzymogenes]